MQESSREAKPKAERSRYLGFIELGSYRGGGGGACGGCTEGTGFTGKESVKDAEGRAARPG